jgi:hypothetical protein
MGVNPVKAADGTCDDKSLPHSRVAPALSALVLSGALLLLQAYSRAEIPHHTGEEPYNTGWEVAIDNDAFSLLSRDADYTGGIAVSLYGYRASQYPIAVDHLLHGIDDLVGIGRLYRYNDTIQNHGLTIGLASFTPSDILRPDPIYDDRPYASLLYLTSSQQTVSPSRQNVHQTSLSIGIFGLRLTEEIQNSVHGILGDSKAAGWRNQISDGGELTARYTVTAHRLIYSNYHSSRVAFELKRTAEASIGYVIDGGMGFSWRWGRLNTPWWATNLSQSEYLNAAAPVVLGGGRKVRNEYYLWGGASFRYRIYNAVLQGQFRDSVVTLAGDQLNRALGEVWLGATREYATGLRVGVAIRARTPELTTTAFRNPVWGSVLLSKSF